LMIEIETWLLYAAILLFYAAVDYFIQVVKGNK